MDNDFLDVIKNTKVERKTTPFKINQLKIEHFYYNDGDLDIAMPISTSVEIKKEDEVWKKIVIHNYLNPKNHREIINNSYKIVLDNYESIISSIEKIDLRDLNNNYFTEEFPEKNSYWELSYNKLFRIVGTQDQITKEYYEISELLDFDKIMKEELKKVEDNI